MKKKVKLKIMSHQLKQKLFILLGEQLFLFTTKRFAGTAGRLSTAINMKAVIVMIISRALQWPAIVCCQCSVCLQHTMDVAEQFYHGAIHQHLKVKK